MSVQPIPHPTFDDWLAAERAMTDARSEFVDGEIFAMTGGTAEHNTISVNVSAELRAQFKRCPCYVYAGDMKVRVDAANIGAYPDVMAVCVTNPTLIIEILSDSTEAYDRGDKFSHYRRLPSLRTYLLLSQHRVSAELYVRQEDGQWLLSTYESLSETVPLESVGASLALIEVYDKVELDSAAD